MLPDARKASWRALEYIPRVQQQQAECRIVYTHGGSYTSGSAVANAAGPALIADLTGIPVLSIDYTLAPHARFDEVTDEVVAVFDALAAPGNKKASPGTEYIAHTTQTNPQIQHIMSPELAAGHNNISRQKAGNG